MTKKTKNVSFITERHKVLGLREAEVLRTRASGDVYQFRMWVSKERKYVRQSLKTDDLHIALQLAKTKALKTIGVIESGKRVFGVNVEELIDLFLAEKKKDVENKYITEGRWLIIRTYLKHFASFIGQNTSVSSLDNQSCYDYAEWRRKQKGGAKDVTIKNEKATINAMMKYAHKKRFTDFEVFEFRKVGKNQNALERRDTFDDNEYEQIRAFLRSWVAKKNNKDTEIRIRRMMIRDMFFAASNTILRIGELVNLRWSDILEYEDSRDKIGHLITLVTIRVRSQTSKVRKERVVTVRGGEYFRRWHNVSKYTKANDFFFTNEKGDDRILKREIYEFWKEIMDGAGINHQEKNITWYSCRHYGITQRLKAGANVFNLAKIAGTSVAQIEIHYGHFDQSMSRETSLLNYRYSKEGTKVLA